MNTRWLRIAFLTCVALGFYNLFQKRYQEALGSLVAFLLIVAVEIVTSLVFKKEGK